MQVMHQHMHGRTPFDTVLTLFKYTQVPQTQPYYPEEGGPSPHLGSPTPTATGGGGSASDGARGSEVPGGDQEGGLADNSPSSSGGGPSPSESSGSGAPASSSSTASSSSSSGSRRHQTSSEWESLGDFGGPTQEDDTQGDQDFQPRSTGGGVKKQSNGTQPRRSARMVAEGVELGVCVCVQGRQGGMDGEGVVLK